jgi:hypothetical protein
MVTSSAVGLVTPQGGFGNTATGAMNDSVVVLAPGRCDWVGLLWQDLYPLRLGDAVAVWPLIHRRCRRTTLHLGTADICTGSYARTPSPDCHSDWPPIGPPIPLIRSLLG